MGRNQKVKHEEFTVVSYNMNGFKVKSRITELKNLVHTSKIDVVMLQETLLKRSYSPTDRSFKDYSVFTPDDKDIKEGDRGLMILVSRRYRCRQVSLKFPIGSNTGVEVMAVEVWNKGKRYTFVNVYNSPNISDVDFEFLTLLPRKRTIVAGDFNAHSALWGSLGEPNAAGEEVLRWTVYDVKCPVFCVEVEPVDADQTRIGHINQKNTSPDLALSTYDLYEALIRKVGDNFGSDHRMVWLSFPMDKQSYPKRHKAFVFAMIRKSGFKKYMEEVTKDRKPSRDTFEEDVSLFSQHIRYAAKRYIPRRRFRWGYVNLKKATLKEIKKRRNLRRSFQKCKTLESKLEYNKQSAIAKRAVLQNVRESWMEKSVSTCTGSNPAGCYKLLKTMMVGQPPNSQPFVIESKIIEDRMEQASLLNEGMHMFSNGKLTRRIKKNKKKNEKFLNEMKDDCDGIFNAEIEMEEMEVQIDRMKKGKAPGCDKVHPIMIKHLGPNSKQYILNLFNLSLKHGIHSPEWKMAIVKAIPKKGKDLTKPITNNNKPPYL